VLVGQVSDAITAFLTQVGTTARANDVVVMVYSEFGRRVEANGARGPTTDVRAGLRRREPGRRWLLWRTALAHEPGAGRPRGRGRLSRRLRLDARRLLGADADKILNNWSTKLDLITPVS